MRNQEFFRAGEVSENKGTSINIFNLQHTKERPQNSILNEKLNPQMKLVRAFFPKFRALLFKFWKRAGESSPPLPHPSSYVPEVVVIDLSWYFQRCSKRVRIWIGDKFWKMSLLRLMKNMLLNQTTQDQFTILITIQEWT